MSDQQTLLLSTQGETFIFQFHDNAKGRQSVCQQAIDFVADPEINFDCDDAEFVFDEMDRLDDLDIYYPYTYEELERREDEYVDWPTYEHPPTQDRAGILLAVIVGWMLGFLAGLWLNSLT